MGKPLLGMVATLQHASKGHPQRCGQHRGHIYIQFSVNKPATLENSRMLSVTTVAPRTRPWAAIHVSLTPIERPLASSAALTAAYCSATVSSTGSIQIC